MCQRDIAASKGKRAATKRAARDVFRTEALSALAERDGGVYEHPEVAGVASTIREAAERGNSAEAFAALEEAGPALAPEVSARSRSLLLLVELCGFEPWPGVKWDAGVHGLRWWRRVGRSRGYARRTLTRCSLSTARR